ncbi:MAG: hypothetical protein ACE5GA_04950, partial [Candidatus Zixiibacteriota bacterium]
MRTQAKPVSSFPSARATCVFTLLITPLALLFCSNVAYAQRTGASAQTVTEDSLKTTYGTKNSLPYVTTDLQEYPPGATVTIYGSGFHSGEIVSLRVDYPQPTGAGFGRSFALSAEADPTGWFQATWILPFDTQVDDTLSLTGEGTFSGRQATTSFSSRNTSLELNILGAVSFCPSDSGAAPDTLIAQAILSQACEPYKDGDLDGREILFFLRSGECEGDHTNLRVDTALTDEQGIAFAAIPIPSGAGNFSIKAKFRGESRPEECREPGNSSCYSGPYRHERCARLSKAKDCREFSVRSDGCSQPALLNCPADTLIDMCAAGEICLWPLRVQDGSGSRVASPDVSLSFGTLRGDSICFVADTPGVYTITAVLADGSGLIDSCQVTAT